MKLVHEIKIKDLLGKDSQYKGEWLKKKNDLSAITDTKIRRVKMALFREMENKIDALKQSFAGSIRIYKDAANADNEFNTKAQIKDLEAKKNPAVSSKLIKWEIEGVSSNMVFQVNFASKEYGGGTFENGFVQEEIKNVLSTTASVLTANNVSLGLAPRKGEKPTPVVIVGQVKDFNNVNLPYGWGGAEWDKAAGPMIKDCAPTTFNELAIAANNLGSNYGSDTEQSVKALFNNSLAGFKLAKEVADAEHKSCKIKTGLFGAGAFHNSPEFSIAMQYLAARIADVEIEFCGIGQDKHAHVEQIFERVDEMISSEMSLDDIVKKELLEKWTSVRLDPGTRAAGWRAGEDIPSLSLKKLSSKLSTKDSILSTSNPEEKTRTAAITWFASSSEKANKIYLSNDSENLPIASPIYKTSDDTGSKLSEKFPFSQKANGNGGCYFYSGMIAILNDCVDNPEKWNLVKARLINFAGEDDDFKKLIAEINPEDAVLTRERVYEILQVRGEKNIIAQLSDKLLVNGINHSQGRTAVWGLDHFLTKANERLKTYLEGNHLYDSLSDGDQALIRGMESICSEDDLSLMDKLDYNDDGGCLRGLCEDVIRLQWAKANRTRSGTYNAEDITPFFKEIYPEKTIVTISRISLPGTKVKANELYLWNADSQTHFDVLYADLDGKIEADLSSTKSSTESEADANSEANEKKILSPESKTKDKVTTPISSDDPWKIPYPAKFKTSETGKAFGKTTNIVFKAFDMPLDGEWPLKFFEKMLVATAGLALSIASGVVEYVIPAVINTITSPVRLGVFQYVIPKVFKPITELVVKPIAKEMIERGRRYCGGTKGESADDNPAEKIVGEANYSSILKNTTLIVDEETKKSEVIKRTKSLPSPPQNINRVAPERAKSFSSIEASSKLSYRFKKANLSRDFPIAKAAPRNYDLLYEEERPSGNPTLVGISNLSKKNTKGPGTSI